jgi:hypothetical protein
MQLEVLEKQIAFLIEIDKVKSIVRRTRLVDNSRYENDAKHSWHLAVMAMILTYGLCGFANFGSLDIMIGGMGAMVPERRREIVELGFKSILGGAVVGILY